METEGLDERRANTCMELINGRLCTKDFLYMTYITLVAVL